MTKAKSRRRRIATVDLGSRKRPGGWAVAALLFLSALLPRCGDVDPWNDRLFGGAGPGAGASNLFEAGTNGAVANGAGTGAESAGGFGGDSSGREAESSGGDGFAGAGGAGGKPSSDELEAGSNAGGAAGGGAPSSAGGSNFGGRSGGGEGATMPIGGATPSGGAGAGGRVPEPPPGPDYILGADISSVQEAVDQGATFVDTDGLTKSLPEILLAHGFNYARLRTFVDPQKLYGYANPNGQAVYVKSEPYCDRDHTAEFGKALKDAGMKLLVDLHYSDNWADPGKQVIPERWRSVGSIEELGAGVQQYTSDLIQTLIDAGARPDIVQIGNEITPGMLIHVPSAVPNADQWGNMDKVVNGVNGASSNWARLGLLLKKGIEGVRAVDPEIRIMLHVENTSNAGGVVAWVNGALAQGVEFDILGLSCYTTWHGQPAVWDSTFRTLASTFPDLSFVIAEYNPEARRANEIMRDLPDRRGLGTFIWEPTQSGTWGAALFSRTGDTYRANAALFAEYDRIRTDFGMD